MKKITKYIVPVAALVFAMFATGCNEDLKYDPVDVGEPEITAVSPSEGPIGTIVTVTGVNLQFVSEVTVGGQVVELYEKVNSKQFSFKATVNGKTGVIGVKAENVVAESKTIASATTYTYTYPAPSPDFTKIPSQKEVNETFVIPGTNLGSINAVYFIAAGESPVEGTILKNTLTEIEVQVPAIEGTSAVITYSYYNGTGYTTTTTGPNMVITSTSPIISNPDSDFAGTHNSRTDFTLTGSNLDKVVRIVLVYNGNSVEADITAQGANTLVFTIPDLVDDETHETTLRAYYGTGSSSIVLSDSFTVFTPSVLYWTNITTWAQGNNSLSAGAESYQYVSFFQPGTGKVIANPNWKTEADPVSFAKKGKVSDSQGSNTTNLTKAEYDQVEPYFFWSGNNSGYLMAFSPCQSESQLRNYWQRASGEGENSTNTPRVTEGGKDDSWFGTPMLTFCYLNKESSPEAAELYEKVTTGQLTSIDKTSMTIDKDAKTVGGIPVSLSGSGTSQNTWHDKYLTVGVTAPNTALNEVFMVFYHGWNEENRAPSLLNVQRIGFIHLTQVNYLSGVGADNPRYSSVTYNVYWQKYDYQH